MFYFTNGAQVYPHWFTESSDVLCLAGRGWIGVQIAMRFDRREGKTYACSSSRDFSSAEGEIFLHIVDLFHIFLRKLFLDA